MIHARVVRSVNTKCGLRRMLNFERLESRFVLSVFYDFDVIANGKRSVWFYGSR